MTPSLSDLKAATLGRWPEIHAALGIPREYLNLRRHCPCPYCGGKDRYRYTDYQGTGGFICNQCTPQGGSGFDLLMLVFGYDFAEAARQVAALLGLASGRAEQHTPRRPLPPPTTAEPPLDKQASLQKIWHTSLPLAIGDPVTGYLKTRGLPLPFPLPSALRYEPALPYYVLRAHDGHTAAPLLIGRYPAMIAAIRTAAGELQGLHLSYLQHEGTGWRKLAARHPETGEALPAKKMRTRYPEALRGAAVHLSQPDDQGRLIAAEGIETALAARALFGLPAVAALSAIGLSRLQWPLATRQLFIVADNDTSNTGQRAAEQLAARAFAAGIQAAIWQPEIADTDALDEYNRRKSTVAPQNSPPSPETPPGQADPLPTPPPA